MSIVKFILYMGMGALLSSMGFRATSSWQFWAAMFILVGVDITSRYQ